MSTGSKIDVQASVSSRACAFASKPALCIGAVVFSLALTGCGQKGPLTPPPLQPVAPAASGSR